MLFMFKARKSQYPIHPLILSRRSLRIMSGEEMSDSELFPLFEAARWSPSFYNVQEWRFVYAKRNTRHWNKFFGLMNEKNQNWTSNASVLIVLLSNMYNTYKGNKSFIPSHSFDTGSAWMALALQCNAQNLVRIFL
jgi:nitroreductase